jgi:hypothetical protein
MTTISSVTMNPAEFFQGSSGGVSAANPEIQVDFRKRKIKICRRIPARRKR